MAEKMPASATNPKLPSLTLTGGVRATGLYGLAAAHGATALGEAELAAERAGLALAVAAAVELGAATGLLAGVAGAPARQDLHSVLPSLRRVGAMLPPDVGSCQNRFRG